MQHLEVSCAVWRFFKSLDFKGLMGKDMTNNWSQQLRWVNFKWLLFRVQEISSTNCQQFSTLVLTVHKIMQNSF